MSRKMLAWSNRRRNSHTRGLHGPAVVDPGHREQHQRRGREDGGPDAGRRGGGQHHQDDAGGERQRRARGVHPAAQPGLDLVEGLAHLLADALGDTGGGGDESFGAGAHHPKVAAWRASHPRPARVRLLTVADWKSGLRRVLYPAYEARLARRLPPDRVPKHVGVMLDGNRRWAKAVGQDAEHGHRAGAANISPLLEWCEDLGVEVVTLWLLSTDNLNRPAAELQPAAGDHRGGRRQPRRRGPLAAQPGRRPRPAARRDGPQAQGGRRRDLATSTASSSTSPSGTAAAARSPTRSGRCSRSTPPAARRSRSSPRSSTSSTSASTSTPRASPTPTW